MPKIFETSTLAVVGEVATSPELASSPTILEGCEGDCNYDPDCNQDIIDEDYISYDGIVGQSGFYLYAQDQIESLEIKSLFHAAYLAIVNLPILLLIPLPWNWTSVFYPIQAIESCLLIYLYFRLSSENNTYKKSEYILLTFILIGGLSIYALIMANEGTFVRYRFTLYYPFLLALLYICRQSTDSVDSPNNKKLIS